MVDALIPKGDEGRGVSAISLGEVASNLWSGDFRMGKPGRAKLGRLDVSREANPLKWNISVSGGKDNKFIPLVAASEKGGA